MTSPEPACDVDALQSLEPIFRPATVAVVGASRRPGSVGNTILFNLVHNGFQGQVFPVNPNAKAVNSIRCYPDIASVPERVDLAMICVPSTLALQAAEECGAAGVRSLCVITAGFREIGAEGTALERKLVEITRRHGMRMVGPNCMGIMNARPETSMDATIAPDFPRPGRVAFLSQSGAMGVSILSQASDMGLGVSMFASVGNKADVSGNDLLAYWENDEAVDVILMYLESFGNPRKFVPLVRRLSREKPVICVKSGRTAEAAKAASSHTGALAGTDVAVDALFEQTGVLRVETVRHLFDVAQALSIQPVPKGNRVAILTNAGGPAILCVDFLVGRGLRLATLSEDTRKELRSFLVPEASVSNPVDMVAGSGADEYRRALPTLLADEGVDMVIAIFVPPIFVDHEAVAGAIAEGARGAEKPVLGCFMAAEKVVDAMTKGVHGWFPVYAFPEEAVRVADSLVSVGRLRDDDLGNPETFDDIDHDTISRVIEAARLAQEAKVTPRSASNRLRVPRVHREWRQERGGWLSGPDVWSIIAAAGLPAAEHAMADSPEAAVEAAARIGGRVALKLDGEAFIHKSDVGGIALDLEGDDMIRGAAMRLTTQAEHHAPGSPYRLLVQPMVEGGVEIVLGSRSDPVFGPVLMIGMGGIHVEILKDVSFGVVPLTRILARRMLRRLRGFRLLDGARGSTPVDVEALETALLRLAAVVDAHPDLLEIEINPLIARPDGIVAVDARARVGAAFGPR